MMTSAAFTSCWDTTKERLLPEDARAVPMRLTLWRASAADKRSTIPAASRTLSPTTVTIATAGLKVMATSLVMVTAFTQNLLE